MKQKSKKWGLLTAAVVSAVGFWGAPQGVGASTAVSGTEASVIMNGITYYYKLNLSGATASGTNATAVGENSEATGDESTAIGYTAKAYGAYATALGAKSVAYTNYSLAAGNRAKVGAEGAKDSGGLGGIAIGSATIEGTTGATVSGDYGIAIGTSSSAVEYSLAIGQSAEASYYSVALGKDTYTGMHYSIAIGNDATVEMTDSFQIPYGGAIAIGSKAGGTDDAGAKVAGKYGIAIGTSAEAGSTGDAGAQKEVAIGYATKAYGVYATALGAHANAYTHYSYSAGNGATVGTEGVTYSGGLGGIAIGSEVVTTVNSTTTTYAAANVTGDYGIAIGTQSSVSTNYATALGFGATVTGAQATAIGYTTKAYGESAIAFGSRSEAYTDGSIVAGTEARVGTEGVTGSGGHGGIAIGSATWNSGTTGSDGTLVLEVRDGARVTGDFGIAIGTSSAAAEEKSVALGYGARGNADNAVALGPYSVADTAYTISVGSTVTNGTQDKFTRKIVNVTAGSATTDAATYGQLVNAKAVTDEAGQITDYTTYTADGDGVVTVKTNDGGTAFKIKVGTSADNSTSYTGSDTITIGTDNNKISVTNMAMSTTGANLGATAGGDYSFAIGGSANASGNQSVALGYKAVAGGTDSEETLEGATVAIGATASATGNGSVALGYGAATTGNDAVALGSTAQAAAKDSGAIGSHARAYNTGAMAIGAESIAYGEGSATLGYNAFAGGARSLALGNEAKAGYYINGNYYGGGDSAVAIGDNSWAIGNYNVAIGYAAAAGISSDYQTLVVGGTAIGFGAGAFGEGATAIGDGSVVNSRGSTAIGIGTYSNAEFSASVGYTAQVQGESGTAIGYQAVVGADKGIKTEDGNKVATVSFGHQNGDTYYTVNEQAGYDENTYNDVVLSRLTNVAYGTSKNEAAAYGQIAKKGQTVNVSVGSTANIESNDGESLYKLTYTKMDSVSPGDKGFVSGADLYEEIRKRATGTYVSPNNDTGTNLSKLDAAVVALNTKISDGVYSGSDTITISNDKKISVTNMAMSTTGADLGATAGGDHSFAIGGSANASGRLSIALGYDAVASENPDVTEDPESVGASIAIGASTRATGNGTVVVGASAAASGEEGIAIGSEAKSEGYEATAIGSGAHAKDASTTALGGVSYAEGQASSAVGYQSRAKGAQAAAFGYFSQATKDAATALGSLSEATEVGASAVGYQSKASGNLSSAFGAQSQAQGEQAVAFGYGSQATKGATLAFGSQSLASDVGASAIGYYSQATGDSATALGYASGALGFGTTALGAGALAYNGADYAMAIGLSAEAQAANAVAIGHQAVASEANTVSFGHKSTDKHVTADGLAVYGTDSFARLTNVADGTGNHDAATYGQLVKNKEYTFDANGVATIETNASTEENPQTAFTLKLAATSGSIEADNGGYVTGGAIYTELRPTSGEYVSAGKTTAQNLGALDTQVKTNADNISTIQTDVSGLKTDVSGLKTDVTNLDSRVTNIESSIGDIGDQISGTKVDGSDITLSKTNNTATVNHVDGTKAFSITIEGLGEGGANYTKGDGIEISDDNTISVKVGDDLTVNENGISVKKDGSVASGNTGIVTGGTVYTAIEAKTGDTTKLASAGLGENLTDSVLSVNEKVGSLSTDISKVGAGAAALAALHPEGYDPNDKWSFAVGYGHYKSANAGAIGAFFKPNADTTFSLGGTIGNGDTMMNAGISFKLGARSKGAGIYQSNVELVREMNNLRADTTALKDSERAQNNQIAAQENRIAVLEAENARMKQMISAILSKMEMSNRVARSAVR